MPRKNKRDRVTDYAVELLQTNLPRGAKYILVTFDKRGHTLATDADEPLTDHVRHMLWELL